MSRRAAPWRKPPALLDRRKAPRKAPCKPSNTARRALASALLLVTLGGAHTAHAQSHPRALLEDTGDFRRALGEVAANVRMSAGEDIVTGRIRRQARGFVWLEGRSGTWSADDDTLAFPLRMAAAMLGSESAVDALAALGFRLDETLITLDMMPTDEGEVLVSRLGGSYASVAIEPEIARLREIRISYGNVAYSAQALAYEGPANGWLPSRILVLADGAPVLEVHVTDVAAQIANLAAAGTPGNTTSTPAVAHAPRFPRMPL